jgi:hypothetical protein
VAYQTTFRAAAWLYPILAIGELICLGGAIGAYLSGRAPWEIAVAILLSLFFTAGIIDLAVSRIVLDKDAMRITELRRRVAVPKRDIVSAKVDGGMVVLQMRDGSWFEVPGTGRNVLAMNNSIRAWLKDKNP